MRSSSAEIDAVRADARDDHWRRLQGTEGYNAARARWQLDENGDPTSDETTVIERWSRPDLHNIHLEMTITDLKYYTRPITFKRNWVLGDPGQGVNEYACNENNLNAAHIGPGAGVIGPDGNRGFGYEDALPAIPPGPEAYEK